MGALVSRLIGFDGCTSFSSRMVLSGTSDFVADETFVVLEVFCPLGQGKIDSVHIHSHRIPRGLSGSCSGGNVVSPPSQFSHLYSHIVKLTSFVKPKFVDLWFFE